MSAVRVGIGVLNVYTKLYIEISRTLNLSSVRVSYMYTPLLCVFFTEDFNPKDSTYVKTD